MSLKKFPKTLVLAIGVVLIVLLACAPTGTNGGDNAPDYAGTESALQATADALNNQTAPTQAPPTQAPPTQAVDTQVPPTTGPVDIGSLSSGDIIYYTEFDSPGDWEDGWIHFSLPDIDYTVYKANGYLRVEVPETFSSVYAIYDSLFFTRDIADVYVETRFQNMGTHNINNISVICRATDRGWYEFSMLSGGLWYIWRYDVDNNKYVKLTDGGIPDLNYDAPHTIGASCVGDTLTFYFDGEKLKNGVIKDKTYLEGQVGLAVYADDLANVIVEFDYFGIQKP